MASQKTITINGRVYDAVTGLPVKNAPESSPAKKEAAHAKAQPSKAAVKPTAKPAAKPAATPRPDFVRVPTTKTTSADPTKGASKSPPRTPRSTTQAKNVHSSVQHSKTLNRRAITKPATPNRPITRRPAVGKQMDVAKSTSVSRFAQHPVVTPVAATAKQAPAPAAAKKKLTPKAKATRKPQPHPVAERALSRVRTKKATAPKTAKQVKDEAISRALATPAPKQKRVPKAKKRSQRRLIIAGIILVVLLIVGFVAYRLAPTLSVSVASAQAGISATYPEYIPDGYSLSQPVTYSEGQVDLKFKSNSNDNFYVISQTRSSWDSSAVLDNIVTPAAGADYVTTKERGLTIYTYDSKAVWVNGGILYEVDSQAPLSGDQIRRIATSL